MKLKIGTRGSKLALWQANQVAEKLKHGEVDTEIVIVETKGDKILDVEIAKIGSKGVFTEEIEEQLKAGNIDIAVHSAKDLQSELPSGFEIVAFTEREKENDVLVSANQQITLAQQDLLIGTSSTRRVATLKHYYPHIKTIAVRGNLQTRIRKMEEGHCDALLLAYAGVHRMGYNHLIRQELSTDIFTPAVGQGSIAVEIFSGLDQQKRTRIRELVNHTVTERRLLAERSFLKRLHGGCSVPVFALAQLQGQQFLIKGGVVSLDGTTIIKEQKIGPMKQAEQMGIALAETILDQGGEAILSAFR